MLVNGGRRRGVQAVAALCCVGVLSVGIGPAGAGARAVTAHTSSCGGGEGSTIYQYGGGTRIVSQVNLPVCVTGRLTVTFAGSLAAGCATNGLCDYAGTETFAPGTGGIGDINVLTTERHGHRSTSATLSLGGPGSPLTSAVQRTLTSPTTTETASCSDTAGTPQAFEGSFLALPVAGRRVTIGLDHGEPPLLGSRCAGPLEVDLASALPSRTIALRTLEHGGMTVDLTGGGPFAAHGLAGTVASTLVLTIGRPQQERRGVAPKPPTQVRVEHLATVRYHVTRLTGSAVATVQGSANPAVCGPFDACGLAGTIAVLPGATAHGAAFLTTVDPHGSLSQLRAELRGGGPRHRSVVGEGQVFVGGDVQADLMQDGNSCSDEVALRQFVIRLRRTGRQVAVSLAPASSQATDPLRTRCPGPDLGSHRFSSARLPAGVLARPAFTVTLRGLPFTNGPYSVVPRSTLRLTLRRGATRVRVIRVPVEDVRARLSRAG